MSIITLRAYENDVTVVTNGYICIQFLYRLIEQVPRRTTFHECFCSAKQYSNGLDLHSAWLYNIEKICLYTCDIVTKAIADLFAMYKY